MTFKPKQHWLKNIQDKKDSKKSKIEIYEEWSLVLEGTTIKGRHLHVYKNNETGLLDWSVEE